MKKVLHYVGKMNRAGLETFIMNMYRNIDTESYQFGFLCTVDGIGDYDQEIVDKGGEIFHVKLDKSSNKLRHIKNYLILKKELKKYSDNFTVFHIHHYHAFDAYIAAKAALGAGFRKVIVHSHSDNTDYHKRLHLIFRKKMSVLPIVRIACSDKAGEWMFTNDFSVLRNGIDSEIYKYNSSQRFEMRDSFGVNEKLVIGHVGRFDPVKNHVFLVNLFAAFIKKNKNSVLLLVGDGLEKDKIKSACKELGIDNNVIFAGLQNSVSKFYQMMDIYIMPSLYEGVSLTAVEAECSGLPCLFSSNISSEIDLRHNVIHCDLNISADEWIAKMQELLSMNNDRDTAYKDIIAKGYDISQCCDELVSIYNSSL